MNLCLECDTPTKNPKFCKRGCSASYHNKRNPKRKVEGKCPGCDAPISTKKNWCDGDCAEQARLAAAAERAAAAAAATATAALKKSTKKIGDACEMEFVYRFAKAGLLPALPVLGENNRWDMLVEDLDGRVYKIQCKSGRLVKGVILFHTTSSHYHRGGKTRGYVGEVDLFGVYCGDLEKLYLISPEALGMGGRLRVDAPKNNMAAGIRWAADFEWTPGVLLSTLEAKR